MVFLKFKFYDKKFSSWLLASHRIILPVWMLKLFLIHFFLYLEFFCLSSTIVDHFSTSDSISDNLRFPSRRLAKAMFATASMASIHVPSLDVENVFHLFGFVLILQRFSSFFHFSTSDAISDNLRFPRRRLAEARFPAASMSSNHVPSLDVENILHLFSFVLIFISIGSGAESAQLDDTL